MEQPRQETIVGQVCCVRALSKKLVFYDVVTQSSHAPRSAAELAPTGTGDGVPPAPQQLPSLQAAAEERWVEVIVKASHFDRVLEARDSIR
jgi:hypothetical protein